MGGGHLAAVLTFGQFIKAIASFIAPYLAIWGTTQVLPSFGYDWRILFAVFLIVGIFLLVSLQLPCLPPLKSANRRPQEPPMVSVASSLRPSPCWANPSCCSPS